MFDKLLSNFSIIENNKEQKIKDGVKISLGHSTSTDVVKAV